MIKPVNVYMHLVADYVMLAIMKSWILLKLQQLGSSASRNMPFFPGNSQSGQCQSSLPLYTQSVSLAGAEWLAKH